MAWLQILQLIEQKILAVACNKSIFKKIWEQIIRFYYYGFKEEIPVFHRKLSGFNHSFEQVFQKITPILLL